MQDNRDDLYLNLRDAGIGEDVIGTQKEFKDFVTNEQNTRDLYNNLRDSGIGEDIIGSEDDFYNFVAPDFSSQKDKAANTNSTQQKPFTQQEYGNLSTVAQDVAKGVGVAPKFDTQGTAQKIKEQLGGTKEKTQFVPEASNVVMATPTADALKKYPFLKADEAVPFNRETGEPFYTWVDENGKPLSQRDIGIRTAKQEITGEREYMQKAPAAPELPDVNANAVKLDGSITDFVDNQMRAKYGDNYLNELFKTSDGREVSGTDYLTELSQGLYDGLVNDVNDARIQYIDADDEQKNQIVTALADKYKGLVSRDTIESNMTDEKLQAEANDERRRQEEQQLDEAYNNAYSQRAAVMGENMAKAQEDYNNASWLDKLFGGSPVQRAYWMNQNDNRIKIADTQINLVLDAKRVLDTGKAYDDGESWSGRFVRGMRDAMKDTGLYDGGIEEMNDLRNVKFALDAYESGNATAEQKDLLDTYALLQTVTGENSDALGRMYSAGQTTVQAIPFMLQMYINPIGSLGQSTAKAATQFALKQFGRSMMSKYMKRLLATSFKAGGRITGDMLAASLPAMTFGAPAIGADMYDRLIGNVKGVTDNEGNIEYSSREGQEKSKATAIAKAIGSNYFEYQSEMVGEYFRPLTNILSAGIGKATEKMGLGQINDLIANLSNKNFYRSFSDFAKRTQWQGTIGEYLEEVVNNAENALFIGDMDFSTGPNGVFNKDVNIDTFLGVAAMTGFMSSLKTADYIRTRGRIKDNLDNAYNNGLSLFGVDEWEKISNELDNIDENNAAKTVKRLVNSVDDNDMKQAIANYAAASAMNHGFNIGDLKNNIEEASDNIVNGKVPRSAIPGFDALSPDEQQNVHDDGMIHSAILYPITENGGNAEQVFIVKGNVALNNDGSIDIKNSSDAIYYKGSDGKIHQVAPNKILAADVPVSVEDYIASKNNTSSNVSQEPSQQAVQYSVGDEVNIDVNGQSMHGEVAGTTEDGNYIVSYENEDGTMSSVRMSPEELAGYNQATDASQQMPEVPTSTNAPQSIEQPVEAQQPAQAVEPVQPVESNTEQVQPANAEGTAQVQQEQSAQQSIPTDEEGNPLYYNAPIEATINDLYDGSLNDEEIQGFIDANIQDAQKKYDSIQKKAPKIGTNKAKYLEQKREWQTNVDEAKRILDYWQSVDNYRKEQTHTTDADIQSAQAELSGDNARAEFDEYNDNGGVNNAVSVASDFIRGAKITPDSFKAETGYGTSEQQKFVGMIAKEENGGKTIDQLAEELVSYDNSELNGVTYRGDTSLAKDAILEALQAAGTRGELAQNNTAEREKYVEARMADLDAQYMEAYGMTYDEYLSYEEQIMPTIWRDYNNYDEIAFNNMYAEEIQQLLNTRENGNTTGEKQTDDRGNQVLSEQQSIEQPGSAGSTEPGTEIQAGVQSNNENAAPQEEAQQTVAQKIADAEAQTDTNPTEAQKEAGNYKKGHVRIDGYDITIEQPKGSVRRGTDANGKQWEQTMNNTYGYIRGTEGVDGDHIDIFLSDNPTEGNVYVVDQVNPDGSFDEHKVMYGFNSAEEARNAYLSNYEEGWQGLGNITEVSKDEFKKWVESSHRKTKPFAEYKSVNKDGAQNEESADNTDITPGDLLRAYESGDTKAIEYAESRMRTFIESSDDMKAVAATYFRSKDNSRKFKKDVSSGTYRTQSFIAEACKNALLKAGIPKEAFMGERKRVDFANSTSDARVLDVMSVDPSFDVLQAVVKNPNTSNSTLLNIADLTQYSYLSDDARQILAERETDKADSGNNVKEESKQPSKEEAKVEQNPTDAQKEAKQSEQSLSNEAHEIFSDLMSKSAHQVEIDDENVTETDNTLYAPIKVDGKDTSLSLYQEEPAHSSGEPIVGVSFYRDGMTYQEAADLSDAYNQYVGERVCADGSDELAINFGSIDEAVRFEEWLNDNGGVRFREAEDDKVSDFALKHNLNEKDVEDYADYMRRGNLNGASRAFKEIRRKVLLDSHAASLGQFTKIFSPVKKELYERFGNVDELRQQYVQRTLDERNIMEAARKRAEEAAEAERRRLQEFQDMSDEQLDEEYSKAVEANDESRMRDLVNEAARRNGYGDVGSEYQGVGAWSAPSNPGYESDEERRAAVENDAPDVNITDIANGYSQQPVDYFTNLHAYGTDTAHGRESAEAINKAIDEVRNGKDPMVKVYRAVPKSVKEGKLRNGDWVTPSRKYAEMHGDNRLEGDYRIIEQEVPASQLWWDGNDINEWGFDDGKGYAYRNTKNNRKLNDLITRDDKGNIIPLSQRFNARKADVRYRFIGEQGAANLDAAEEATTRLDNLSVARRMESAGKDAKTIKAATGWERGADNQWRYETPDFKFKENPVVADFDGYSLTTLESLINDEELFKAYPQLSDMLVQYQKLPPGMLGAYSSKTSTFPAMITLDEDFMKKKENPEWRKKVESMENEPVVKAWIDAMDKEPFDMQAYEKAEKDFKASPLWDEYNNLLKGQGDIPRYIPGFSGEQALAHEIQHAIQDIEGFSSGTNTKNKQYKESAGEVEARNVEKRFNMTPELRRQSLASETEDVAREDQIFLEKSLDANYSIGDTKTISGGRQITFTRANPTTTFNSLKKRLDKEGIDYKWEQASTGSRYINYERGGVNYEIRSANHTKGEYGSYDEEEDGINILTDNNKIYDVEIDLSRNDMRIDDIYQLMDEVDKFNNSNINLDEYEQRLMPPSAALKEDYPIIYNAIDNSIINSSSWLGKKRQLLDEYNNYLNENTPDMMPFVASNGVTMSVDENGENVFTKDGEAVTKRHAQNVAKLEREKSIRNYVRDNLLKYDDWLNGAHPEIYNEKYNSIIPAVNETAEKLNLNVRIVNSPDEITNAGVKRAVESGRKIKGWFDTDTNEIVVYMPNTDNVDDAIRTVLHEGVAHYGLRQLVGEENFNTFLDNIYNNVSDEIKSKIDDIARKNKLSTQVATEEYLAGLAETTNFEEVKNSGVWDKIKDFFMDLLTKAGVRLDNALSDNELRYILWRSYDNLQNPTRDVINTVRDITKQRDLNVGNYAVQNSSEKVADNDDIRYREVDDELPSQSRNKFRELYEEGIFDRMQPMKRLQEAIEKETSQPIQPEENVYLQENRAMSIANRKYEIWERSHMEPVREAVVKLMKDIRKGNFLSYVLKRTNTKRNAYNAVVQYMKSKQGLENNEYRRNMEAEAAREPFEAEIGAVEKLVKDGNISRAEADKRQAKLKEQADKAETESRAKTLNQDYSGLQGIYGKDFEQKAKDYVGAFEESFKTDDFWKTWNGATKAILEEEYKSGLLSKELYDKIRGMYKYYIPLKGWAENRAEDVYTYYTTGSGDGGRMQRRKGRTSESDDPLVTLEQDADRQFNAAARNNVKRSLYNLATTHKSDLLTVRRQWYQNMGTKENPDWQRVDAEIPEDATPEEIQQIISDFEKNMGELAKNGTAMRQKRPMILPYHATKRMEKEHTVKVMVNGKEYVIYVNGNPAAAQAVNGTSTPKDADNKFLENFVLRPLRWFNRTRAALLTAWNFNFIPSNLARDAQYSIQNMKAKEPATYVMRYVKNLSEGMAKMTSARLFYKDKKGTLDMNDPTERLFKEFLDNGGETGYSKTMTLEQRRRSNMSAINKLSGIDWTKGARLFFDTLAYANRSIETIVRFAAYKTSRESGRSIVQSINDAKEASVNFDKHGSGEYGNKEWRLLYIFANVKFQSMRRMLENATGHPVRFTLAQAERFALGFAVPMLAKFILDSFGDDDEKDAYDALPEWMRQSGLTIPISPIVPGVPKRTFLYLPFGPEDKVWYALGEMSYHEFNSDEPNENMAKEFASLVADLLPVDVKGYGGNMVVNLAPTAVQDIVALEQNVNYWGQPIYRETMPYNENEPGQNLAFAGTPEWFVKRAEDINRLTGGNDYSKGAFSAKPEQIEYIINQTGGGVTRVVSQIMGLVERAGEDGNKDIPALKNTPVLSSFVKQAEEKEGGKGFDREAYYKYINEYEKAIHDLKAYTKGMKKGDDEASRLAEELKKSPAGERMDTIRNNIGKIRARDKAIRKLNEIEKSTPKQEMQLEELKKESNEMKNELVDKLDDITEKRGE